jgi:hypothetical protein
MTATPRQRDRQNRDLRAHREGLQKNPKRYEQDLPRLSKTLASHLKKAGFVLAQREPDSLRVDVTTSRAGCEWFG